MYVYDNMGRLYVSQDKSLKINGFAYNELGTLDKTTNEIDNYSITLRNYAFKNPYGPNKVIDLRGTYDDSVSTYRAYVSETTQYSYYPTGKLKEQYGAYTIDTGIDGVKFNPYVEYKYDSRGNIVSALHGTVDNVNEMTWGATTHYEYNKNRLSKVQINGSGTRNNSNSVNVSYEYYDDGKLKSVSYPALTDGSILKSEYVYDGLSRLTSLTNYKGTDVLSSYIYTYDSNGNILTTTETVGSTQNSVAYTYDKLNRIASVSGTKGADFYYEYDVRGNRKANFEQIDYLFEESAIFIYDAEDNLDRSQVGDNITHFEYSANGYRYFKKENSDMPEYYVYDPNGRLQAIAALVQLSMTDGSSIYAMYPVTQYIWGPDRVLAKIYKTTNKSYYYLYNVHGDVVQIVDTPGAIKNTYDYDIWGNFLKTEETIENHFTYFGQTYDETTGLYYLRARYYDPTTGRFTQQDPAEDGYNWYIYGNQNPVVYADSTGEAAETIIDIAGTIWSLADFIKNPSLINAAFLVWDVASVVIPFVPGSYVSKTGKYILKAGSNADDVVDSLKALNKVQRIDAIKDGAVVLPYKALKKLTKGTGLESHHLIEKRFANTLGISENDILSIALDKDTHQKITNAFRKALPYSTMRNPQNHSMQKIWDKTKEVYTEMGMTEYL